jgi:hypothetical protein
VIPAGIAGKSPGWRAGAWIIGVVVILLVFTFWLDFPFDRNAGNLTWMLGVAGFGFLFTIPHGRARLRGDGPWVAAPDRVAVQLLRPPTYVWYLILVRMPIYLGDLVASGIWTLYARLRSVTPRRNGRAQGAGSHASVLHGRPQEEPILRWMRRR